MSLRTLARLYVGQVRSRPIPELLALVGLAAGVALLFAVQVANKSVTGSFDQLVHGLAGKATFEAAARGPQGFSQGIEQKIGRLPDVRLAAAVLERRVAVSGPRGRQALTLIGTDDRLKRFGGKLVARIARRRDIANLGFYLTSPVARAIGARPGDEITLEVGERKRHLALAGVADANDIGSLIHNPVAIAQLGLVQELTGMRGRITRVLVAPVPGREAAAQAGVERVSGGRLNVRPSDAEASLLEKAAAPDRQPSALFSVISLVVGILLAYNAMLLTIEQRRRAVASLHLLGASNATIIASLTFGALVLGLAGSILGILLGDQLSRHVLHQAPGFLTSAFAIGSQRVVSTETVLLSIAGGTLAALAAVARPAIELVRVGGEDLFTKRSTHFSAIGRTTTQVRLAFGGVGVVALSVAIALAIPATTLFAAAGVVAGMLMMLPLIIVLLLKIGSRIASASSSPALRVSVGELAQAPVRATALAAIGALALFAILAITGPTKDIQRGMRQVTTSFFGNGDLWISPGRKENYTLTFPFDQRQAMQRLKRQPEIARVRTYRGSFLDLNGKRVWVIAESQQARQPVAGSQIVEGDTSAANRRLRAGGWVALTRPNADELGLKLGESFSLPTPTGSQRVRLAATVTNYGWPTGALIMSSRDYARMWGTKDATAIEVDLAPGVTPSAGKAVVRESLGSASPLKVQTGEEGQAAVIAATREGLARLNQIAAMVIVAAILAVAAAMLGSIWQRRNRMWGLVSLGMGQGQLTRTVFLETGVVLLLGCIVGIAFGFLGQAVGDRWLYTTAAYPVPYAPAWGLALTSVGLAVVFGALAAALPTRFAFSQKRVLSFSSE